MASSSLSTLRTQLRNKLAEVTARFYTNTELNQYINEAYKFYTIKMIQLGQDYFKDSGTIDIVANQSEYDLIALFPTFYELSQLLRVIPFGAIPLVPNERRYRPTYTSPSVSGVYYTPTYRKMGINLKIDPEPQFSETGGLILEYFYVPTFLSADADIFDSNFPSMFEPMITNNAAIMALQVKDASGGMSDTGPFQALLAKQEKLFEDSLIITEYTDSVEYFGNNYSSIF